MVCVEGMTRTGTWQVKHSRSRTPSPLLRSNKNHERVNSNRCERKMVESKITLGVRESTYPVV